MDKIDLLSSWIKDSKSTVIFTGAGMSTESGIPDFRSKNGWWRNIDPTAVASTIALEKDYELFREFYIMRIKTLEACKPNRGHKIIADWEEQGLVTSVATQNVDRFHQEAGSRNVYELHGNIKTIRCQDCNEPAELSEFIDKKSCSKCQGRLRPNVVLFGESLPADALDDARRAIEDADLVIVIGTSLKVYPVSQLPSLSRGKKVYINLDIGTDTVGFDMLIEGRVGDVLSKLDIL